jgi:hypothetical protein
MTLNLTDAEMRILEELCSRHDTTKMALVRRALRMFQTIDARLERGDKVFIENELEKRKTELVVL